jgi:uncharacterized protein (TIGR03545 family)
MSDKTTDTKKSEKKLKKKGPFRWEAIIPIAIFIGLVWAYVTFMLDSHLRQGLELAASKVYGAQVDVGYVNIKFTEPSLTIGNVQITDKETPSLNVVAVGRIRFALLWDALLRAKVVIDESSITDIALYSPRKKPGKVFPPPPPDPKAGPSLTDKISEELKAEAEAQLKNNIFGDVAKILSGTDATKQLEQMREQLVSEAKIKELQTTLVAKRDEWTKRIDNLPKPAEVKSIIEKVKSTKINTSNPFEAGKQLEGLRKDVEKVQDIVKTYEKTHKDVEKDVNGFNAGLKDIDEAVRKDMEALQNKFQLPTIDKQSLTKALLNKVMGDKLVKLTSFMDKAKAYLPDKNRKANKEAEYVPHPRGKGRTYKFPITVGYPLFWLKKAAISSKSTAEGFSGDFSGMLLNVTTDPALINKPTEVRLAGDAPRQDVRGVDLKLVMDYRGDVGTTKMDLVVQSHPFPEQMFASTSDITFGIAEAPASLKARAKYSDGQVDANISETIINPSFKTDAKAPLLKEALTSVTQRIKTVDMEVSLSGGLMNPKMGLDSNLGTELAAGFQRHLNEKIEEAKAKLKSFVDDRIKGERSKLTAEFKKVEDSFNKVLKGKESELKNLQGELDKAFKEKGKAGSKKMQDDIKNQAKDALKRFGL